MISMEGIVSLWCFQRIKYSDPLISKAIYGLVNLTYGNGIDAVASNRNNGVTVPSNRENR